MKFLKQFFKKIHAEAAVLRCLQDRCTEKSAKFIKKHQCWRHFLKKSPEIKRPQHRCFPVNFEKLLRTPFLQSTSGGVGVCLLKSFTFRSSQKGFWMTSCKWSFIKSQLAHDVVTTLGFDCILVATSDNVVVTLSQRYVSDIVTATKS